MDLKNESQKWNPKVKSKSEMISLKSKWNRKIFYNALHWLRSTFEQSDFNVSVQSEIWNRLSDPTANTRQTSWTNWTPKWKFTLMAASLLFQLHLVSPLCEDYVRLSQWPRQPVQAVTRRRWLVDRNLQAVTHGGCARCSLVRVTAIPLSALHSPEEHTFSEDSTEKLYRRRLSFEGLPRQTQIEQLTPASILWSLSILFKIGRS